MLQDIEVMFDLTMHDGKIEWSLNTKGGEIEKEMGETKRIMVSNKFNIREKSQYLKNKDSFKDRKHSVVIICFTYLKA